MIELERQLLLNAFEVDLRLLRLLQYEPRDFIPPIVHSRAQHICLIVTLILVHAKVALCIQITTMIDKQFEDLVIVPLCCANNWWTRAKEEEVAVLRLDPLVVGYLDLFMHVKAFVKEKFDIFIELEIECGLKFKPN